MDKKKLLDIHINSVFEIYCLYTNTDGSLFAEHQHVNPKDTWVVAVYVAVVQDEGDAFQFSDLKKQHLL